jgi:biopolymer transport protein ExbD/biopolymer transport protein TolR
MAYKVQVGPMMAAPNVIPMADIMLVLLIIFMVVTPMLQSGVPVDLAKVNNPIEMENADKDDAVIVAVSASGDIFLLKNKTDISKLTEGVRNLITGKPDKTVFIKSDGRAKYGDVVKVVDEIRSAGVDNIGLLTDKVQPSLKTPPGD